MWGELKAGNREQGTAERRSLCATRGDGLVGGDGLAAVCGVEFDRRELESLGKLLDWRYGGFEGRTVGEFLAETLLKVRGKDGRLYALKGNAAQRAFERRRGAGNIVLKARQMGMTTWVAGRFLLKTITRPGTLTLQVAHTQESAEEILGIVHRFVEHLPAGLRAGALKRSKSSVRQIVFPEIDSEYRVVSAADRNAGRGMTFQNLHCSEVSRWSGEASEVLAGLRAGLAAGWSSRDSLVTGPELVLESTPYGVGGCFYDEWQRAGETGMVRHFFPWWEEAGYRSAPVEEASLTGEERELMRRVAEGTEWAEFLDSDEENDWGRGDGVGAPIPGARCGAPGLAAGSEAVSLPGLDLEQIGYRRGMRAAQGAMAAQEFAESPEECFLATGDPFFDMEAVERRLQTVTEPWKRRRNGEMEIWLPPMTGRSYVVAVDPAGGGTAGDYSVIVVLDRETGRQCAEFAGHVSGLELVEVIRDIGWDYNTAWVVVERNNHGHGVLCNLADRGYREIFKGSDGQHGFLTTSISRPRILARMAAAMVDSPEIFMSRRLLVECRSFVRRPNGGMGARNGAHDDRVMAMAIGLAGRAELLERRV